jgi:DNA-binding SARP family transcriptional activator
MEYRILGHLEVAGEGGPLPLGSRKQRELLALLLVAAGRVVSDDMLIEALWGNAPPRDRPNRANSLHVLVSRLRRILGAETIVRRNTGYVLEVAPDAVDAYRFEQLVQEGRSQLAADDAAGAAATFAEALSLWRGEALVDFHYQEFARAEIARLEELRVAALEDRAEAELALGRHRELLPSLEALVVEHPYREGFRRQLAIALYRSGRQADALEAYRAARETLVVELGLEPSAELRALERAILRQDPALDLRSDTPRAARPSPHRGLIVAAGAVLAVAAAAAGFAFLGGSSGVKTHADSLALIDPRSSRVASTVALPFTPQLVSAAGRYVWVGAAATNAVVRLDSRTGRQMQVVGVSGLSPKGVVADAGGAWVASPVGRTLVRIERFEPGFDQPRATLELAGRTIFNSGRATPLTEGGGALWVSNGETHVAKFDLQSGERLALVEPDAGAGPIGFGGGAAWTAYTISDSVTRIDGRSADALRDDPACAAGPAGPAHRHRAAWDGRPELRRLRLRLGLGRRVRHRLADPDRP